MTWTAEDFFQQNTRVREVKGEAVCLYCGTHVAGFNNYNLKSHYVTKHEERSKNLSDEGRAKELETFLAQL